MAAGWIGGPGLRSTTHCGYAGGHACGPRVAMHVAGKENNINNVALLKTQSIHFSYSNFIFHIFGVVKKKKMS